MDITVQRGRNLSKLAIYVLIIITKNSGLISLKKNFITVLKHREINETIKLQILLSQRLQYTLTT